MDRTDADHEDPTSHEVIPGTWRSEDNPMPALHSRQRYTSSQSGKVVRDHLRDYVNSPAGAVSWQESMI